MENKRGVISLSGGMDSTTLLYWAIDKGYEMEAIAFDYGQNHNKEINLAKWHCEKLDVPLKIIKLDFLNDISNSSLTSKAEDIPEGHYAANNMKSTVVPFRNGIFLSVLTAYAEANEIKVIFLGNHAGDHAVYPDCRTDFVNYFSKAAALGTYTKVEVATPFTDITKSDICKLGLKLELPYNKTWSCYKGNELPCGKCGTCVERTEAFALNNVIDPLYKNEQAWQKAYDYWKRVI